MARFNVPFITLAYLSIIAPLLRAIPNESNSLVLPGLSPDIIPKLSPPPVGSQGGSPPGGDTNKPNNPASANPNANNSNSSNGDPNVDGKSGAKPNDGTPSDMKTRESTPRKRGPPPNLNGPANGVRYQLNHHTGGSKDNGNSQATDSSNQAGRVQHTPGEAASRAQGKLHPQTEKPGVSLKPGEVKREPIEATSGDRDKRHLRAMDVNGKTGRNRPMPVEQNQGDLPKREHHDFWYERDDHSYRKYGRKHHDHRPHHNYRKE